MTPVNGERTDNWDALLPTSQAGLTSCILFTSLPNTQAFLLYHDESFWEKSLSCCKVITQHIRTDGKTRLGWPLP